MTSTPDRQADEGSQTGVPAGRTSAKEAANNPTTDGPVVNVKPDRLALLRRGTAVIAAFSAVALFFASIWVPNLKVCKETAGGTNFTNTTSCNPWSLTELLPLLLLAALFVLPDFSELSIVNLVTFKRELKAQKQELDATISRQAALESQVIGQLAQLNSVQNVNVHYVDPAHLSEAIQGKRQASQSNAGQPERGASTYDGPRAATAMTLLAEWEQLAERLGFGRPRDRALLDDKVQRFRSLFRDEIDTVRRVRNSVAHNVYVDDTVLESALSAARELNSMLSREL